MKISSASKKVLASALSAAMVVAFAPTVALGAQTKVATNTYYNQQTGAEYTVDSFDFDKALAAATAPEYNDTTTPTVSYDKTKATVALEGDVELTTAVTDGSTGSSAVKDTAVTIDLAGHTLTAEKAQGVPYTLVGEGTVKQASGKTDLAFTDLTVGTDKKAADVTFDGGTYGTAATVSSGSVSTAATGITVADGSSIAIKGGTFYVTAANEDALKDAADAAAKAGATVVYKNASGAITTASAIDANGSIEVTSTVATKGDKTYSTLAAAVTDSTTAGDITLQSNLDAASVGSLSDADAVIDLNGHTIERGTLAASTAGNKGITLKGEGKLLGTSTSGNIVIDEGASVSVDNSAAKKNEKQPTKSALSGSITVNGALTVADGAKGSSAAAVDVKNGGSFAAAKGEFGAVDVKAGGSAAISGGEYTSLAVAVNATATVSGGEFSGAITSAYNKGVNLTVSKARYTGSELDERYIAEGSVIDQYAASGKYEVGAPVAAGKVSVEAQDGTKYTADTKFASLQGAVYKADAKSTVALAADVEETVEVAKEIAIDLGGKTVKGGIVAKAGAKVSIDNGSVVGDGTEAVKVEDGEATIKGGTYSAEVKTDRDGSKSTPAALTTVANGKKLTIQGGTFKNATYAVNGTVQGGTFDKKVTVASPYVATQNDDKTWTVALGGVKAPSFGAVNGVIEFGTTFKVADKDKALEKAVQAAYSKVLTAAWSANPGATELAGLEFAKDENGKALYKVSDITTLAGDATYKLSIENVATKDVTLKSDKDYDLSAAYKVSVAIQSTDGNVTYGYLTGIAADVTWTTNWVDTTNYTYKFVGADNAKYDAAAKAYTFSTTTGAQFAVESVSNSILELQEQMKAQQDKDALAKVKGKTVKAKAKKKTTAELTVVTSETGSVSTFKKTSGNAKITVSKAGKVTVKKGLKAGKTYTAKVKATVGTQTKTVKVTVKVSK